MQRMADNWATPPGRVQSVGLVATHTFTPNILFDWNFGYNRQRLGSTFDLVSATGSMTWASPEPTMQEHQEIISL